MGHEIPPGEGVLDLNERPTQDEVSDPFQRFASSKAAPRHKVNKFAYHAKGTRMPAHMVNITTGYMPVDALKKQGEGIWCDDYGVYSGAIVRCALPQTARRATGGAES